MGVSPMQPHERQAATTTGQVARIVRRHRPLGSSLLRDVLGTLNGAMKPDRKTRLVRHNRFHGSFPPPTIRHNAAAIASETHNVR